MIGLTCLTTNGRPLLAPTLNERRAVFVLTRIDEILAWEKAADQERDSKFVDLGRYLGWEGGGATGGEVGMRDGEEAERQRGDGRDPADQGRDAGDPGRDEDLDRRGDEQSALLAPDAANVDLDAHLEQEEYDAEIGQQLDLVPIGHVAGREWRYDDAQEQVADDRGQPDAACDL